MMLALTGCIFSRKPLFDIREGATDIEVGRFEGKSTSETFTFEVVRHGNLYITGDERDPAILSLHGIGDGFYLVTVILPGSPINYGVLDGRSRERLLFAFLRCFRMPDELVPSPDAEGHERCNATDGERLVAIAKRYKADMMANRLEPSAVSEYTRLP
jgi:hypothetical protein